MTLKRRNAPKAVRSSSDATHETEVARLTRELKEALEQKTATSEVLRVISSSPGELEPVFSTILGNATRICGAKFGTLYLREADGFRTVAMHNAPPAFVEMRQRNPVVRPKPGTVLASAVTTRRAVQIADVQTEADVSETSGTATTGAQLARLAGARTVVAVPMVKEDQLIGAILIFRQEVQPFSDNQIELLTNFAAQAVIAIENTRLLNELRQRTSDLTERTAELTDSLEQQTATSEVLQVISSSPGDLQPVFATMLENAVRICDAKFGNIYRWDGDALHLVASHNVPPAFADARRRSPRRPSPEAPTGRLIANKMVIHTANLAAERTYIERGPDTVTSVEVGGVRSLLSVPMLKEKELIGGFTLSRHEVRPFTDRQIELVKSFAAQAVIAIENARLLNELRQRTTDLTEALEQQTATANVLEVISSSTGDLEPVFGTMLEKAVHYCDANFGTLFLHEDDQLSLVAAHNMPTAFPEAHRGRPGTVPGGPVEAAIRTRRTVHMPDLAATQSYLERHPRAVDAVELGGVRTVVAVPMLKDDDFIGVIAVHRREVRPFTNKQIDLVQNFAAQAVIAIENARLLNELRQSLEQQTATSQVLQVISSSPGDLEPVFTTILENAARICDAKFGNIYLWDGDAFRLVAAHNTPLAFAASRRAGPFRPKPSHPFSRMVATKQVIHVADAASLPAYIERDPEIVAPVELGGVRTCLAVPMLKENEVIGALIVYRQEVRTFTDKQIALVTSLASQAVIAIENTRLLNELRQRTTDLTESLEQQTATSEVLQVISSSPGVVEPVFQAMLENAVRICDATFGNIYRWDGENLHLVAANNTPGSFVQTRARIGLHPGANDPVGRMIMTKAVVHTADLAAERDYIERRNPGIIAAVEVGGVRTLLAVPLLKDNQLIGSFHLSRQEVRPFSGKQITLITDFAAQAVVAIENARLLTELHQRTDDLTEALGQQTATSEVLSVISSSPGDLEPVFSTMLEKAVHICDAKFGNIYRWDNVTFDLVATFNTPPDLAKARRRSPVRPSPGNLFGRMLATKAAIHVADLAADERYIEQRDPTAVAGVELGGIRTLIAVPMLKDKELIGALTVFRQEVRPFTDKQIELVKSFAARERAAAQRTARVASAADRHRRRAQGHQPFHLRPADGARYFGRILGAPLCRR